MYSDRSLLTYTDFEHATVFLSTRNRRIQSHSEGMGRRSHVTLGVHLVLDHGNQFCRSSEHIHISSCCELLFHTVLFGVWAIFFFFMRSVYRSKYRTVARGQAKWVQNTMAELRIRGNFFHAQNYRSILFVGSINFIRHVHDRPWACMQSVSQYVLDGKDCRQILCCMNILNSFYKVLLAFDKKSIAFIQKRIYNPGRIRKQWLKIPSFVET